jgi:hypothetical protein
MHLLRPLCLLPALRRDKGTDLFFPRQREQE